MHQKLFDIGWSDESECQECHKETGTEKQRLHPCPEWYKVRRKIPEASRKWESEKHKSWSMPAEGFKGHIATDGSLLGTAGKWEHVVGLCCTWITMKIWDLARDVRLGGSTI